MDAELPRIHVDRYIAVHGAVDRAAPPSLESPTPAVGPTAPAATSLVPPSPDGTHVAAFIDLGTNSVRLLVVRVDPGRVTVTLTQQKEVVRLGEGEFGGPPMLQPQAMDRAVLVSAKFAELARSYGAAHITAVATSATREARNRGAFLRRLEQEADLEVHVISGKEEARLIYLGLANAVHLDDQQAVFIDIGGGSTECIVGDQRAYLFLDTINTGAIRLTARAFGPDETGPVSRERYDFLQRIVRQAAVHAVQGARLHRIDLAIGSSGTILNLATIAARTLHDRPFNQGDLLTFADLRRTAKLLCSLPLEERRKVPGINPERADLIVAGAAILQTLMDQLRLDAIRPVSDVGVREGLLADYLSRVEGDHRGELSIRERSILQLGRTCGFDEPHARKVAELALELFDSAREAGLHGLGDRHRELLSYAALLHDVGTFLSYSNHHLHTYYLIRNADLLGFDQDEIAMMAATAYFHRKGQPSVRNEAYAAMDQESRKEVRFLSALLRLAENLDRSHTASVAHARLLPGKSKGALLEITPAKECRLELWAVEDRQKAVEKSLGRRLTIEVVGAPDP